MVGIVLSRRGTIIINGKTEVVSFAIKPGNELLIGVTFFCYFYYLMNPIENVLCIN